MYNIDKVFENAAKVALHPPPWIGNGLVACAIRGDVGGVQLALKKQSDLNSVDPNVLFVLMGIRR
jgi:hypothetical protein